MPTRWSSSAGLVFGPLWQFELSRTMGVSRRIVVAWAMGQFAPQEEGQGVVPQRIGELQRLLKAL
jgi:hypothetical protein